MKNEQQIEAYKKMAKEVASVGMEARIKANLEKTCDKYKGYEDKFPGCIAYLVSVVKEILGGKNGEVDDNVCYRICRDYFNDELWKKEAEEKAKKELEAAKHKTAKKAEKAKKKTVFKSTPTPPNPIIEAAKKAEEPKPEEKPVEKKEAPPPSPLQLDLFATGAV